MQRTTSLMSPRFVHALLFLCFTHTAIGDENSKSTVARKPVKLPGMVIDLEQRCLDLEARICLDNGFLELLACSAGTKEHESVVAVSAKPMHIHTALLLLGADNGHPAMRKPVNQDKTHWIDVPPRGGRVDVFLVTETEKGNTTERPISDFIVRARDRLKKADGKLNHSPQRRKSTSGAKQQHLSNTFLFVGSQLRNNSDGPRQYVADVSGNVISIATFGDEVLCLPSQQSQDNNSLIWHVKAKSLPPVGTKVTLRLRPHPHSHSKDVQPRKLPAKE